MTFEVLISYLKDFFADFVGIFADMSPYLLFGFFMAGLLSVLISKDMVERHLGGKGILPVVKASLFGVPLPLCSCSVIPVSMSLNKHGASKGATISFLLSTPQTGIDSIFVTLSLLGPVFAIVRPVAAFLTGVIGGTAVDIFGPYLKTGPAEKTECTDACCDKKSKDSKIVRGLRHGFITLPRDIGRAMLIGLLIAAAISAVVPEDFFATFLGPGILTMVIMMLLGIPVYVCATASVPLAAVLIAKGVSPGAALVFLMTGPATNAASLVTIWKTLGARTAVIYLLTVAGCALASGILLDYIAAGTDFQVVTKPGQMLPDIIRYLSAAVLLGLLIYGIISKRLRRKKMAPK